MKPRKMILESRLVVCVGSGGVGKTTTAAAMGVWAAVNGRRVLVLTIDPAKRLANSLGLREFGNAETRITLPVGAKGELWAMMLDTQTTFDELITKMAPDKATSERILANRIYRTMSDTFAGSQEYMAAEKLHDVITSGRYDLVVLDTPPVKNALDFFEAPSRLSRFFDRRIIRWFLQPYEEKRSFSLNIVSMGTSSLVFRLLGFVFGKEFLDDLSDFLRLFKDMYEGFRERHETVLTLFRARSTSFITVCAPTEPSVEVASFFTTELRERRYNRGGILVNQVHAASSNTIDAASILGVDAARLAADLEGRTAASLVARLGVAHARLRQLAASEREIIGEVRRMNAPDDAFVAEIPWLERQVYDVGALLEVAEHLFRE